MSVLTESRYSRRQVLGHKVRWEWPRSTVELEMCFRGKPVHCATICTNLQRNLTGFIKITVSEVFLVKT